VKRSASGEPQPESADRTIRIPTTIHSEPTTTRPVLEDTGVAGVVPGVVPGVSGLRARTTGDVDYVRRGKSMEFPSRQITSQLDTGPAAAVTRPLDQRRPVSPTTVTFSLLLFVIIDLRA